MEAPAKEKAKQKVFTEHNTKDPPMCRKTKSEWMCRIRKASYVCIGQWAVRILQRNNMLVPVQESLAGRNLPLAVTAPATVWPQWVKKYWQQSAITNHCKLRRECWSDKPSEDVTVVIMGSYG